MAQMVAEEMGLPIEAVTIATGDTIQPLTPICPRQPDRVFTGDGGCRGLSRR